MNRHPATRAPGRLAPGLLDESLLDTRRLDTGRDAPQRDASLLGPLRGVVEHLRAQRDYRRLLEQPDHLLADIGVTREQVRAAMNARRLF